MINPPIGVDLIGLCKWWKLHDLITCTLARLLIGFFSANEMSVDRWSRLRKPG